MLDENIAVASTRIFAPTEVVWNALLDPDAVQQFMFGARVISDFHEGRPIKWQGEWQGKRYEDKGTIVKLKPLRLLKYTHYSPLSGKPDKPENYHTVTIELTEEGPYTRVTLTQDNNDSHEAKVHSEKNWNSVLSSLKKLVEAAGHVSSPPP